MSHSSRSLDARPMVLGCLVLILSMVLSFTVAAAPKAELWPRWQVHDPESSLRVDHQPWDRLLKQYVHATAADGINRFDYAAVNATDRRVLDDYVDHLRQTNVDALNRAEQKALWINLYNALTIQVVLDHYPVRSIRQIKLGGWFAGGPWDAELVTVNGEALSLNDIEHRILRPIWRDPLIHYGVNCASLGCPDLLVEAYVGARVDEQLAENARAFVNSQRGVAITNRGLRLSSVYRWFAEDFGATNHQLFEHLGQYAGPELTTQLAQSPKIRGYRYDWLLNDSKENRDSG